MINNSLQSAFPVCQLDKKPVQLRAVSGCCYILTKHQFHQTYKNALKFTTPNMNRMFLRKRIEYVCY